MKHSVKGTRNGKFHKIIHHFGSFEISIISGAIWEIFSFFLCRLALHCSVGPFEFFLLVDFGLSSLAIQV